MRCAREDPSAAEWQESQPLLSACSCVVCCPDSDRSHGVDIAVHTNAGQLPNALTNNRDVRRAAYHEQKLYISRHQIVSREERLDHFDRAVYEREDEPVEL